MKYMPLSFIALSLMICACSKSESVANEQVYVNKNKPIVIDNELEVYNKYVLERQKKEEDDRLAQSKLLNKTSFNSLKTTNAQQNTSSTQNNYYSTYDNKKQNLSAYAVPKKISYNTSFEVETPKLSHTPYSLKASNLDFDYSSMQIDGSWAQIYEQLVADGLDSKKTAYFLSKLPSTISQDPMGLKVKELYSINFKTKPKTTTKKSPRRDYTIKGYKTPGPWYKNHVTARNAQKCNEFINENYDAFIAAEKKYGVPKEVIAALLYTETRLGDYLGSETAFYTLASMASSKNYKQIPEYMSKLPKGATSRTKWINTKMQQRSKWAYNEFRALTKYLIENNLDPFAMPGSMYGAIGLCQFMPSNIDKFGVDGNNDGIINLFDPADAIASASNYLHKHNWKTSSSTSSKQKVLRKYNNLTIYANSILALAERITKERRVATR